MAEKFSFSADYLKWLPRFLLHDDFIDGQRESVAKYLVPHQSERSDAIQMGTTETVGNIGWKVRNERLENDNLCEPIIMYWLGYFSQEIVLKDAFEKNQWPDILSDLDGEGSLDYRTFVRHFFSDLTGYGRIGALVEGPPTKAEGATEARAAGERSFVSLWEPWRICKLERWKDFGPKKGKLREVAIIESTERGESDSDRKTNVRRFWIDEQGGNYKSQRLVLKGDILAKTSGKDAFASEEFAKPQDVLSAGPEMQGAFDEIPFVVLGTNPKQDSVVYSVVPKNREHLNKKSGCDSVDYYTAFRLIFGFGIDPNEVKYATERNMILVQNTDAKVQEIPPGDSTILHADLDKIEREAAMAGTIEVVQKHQSVSAQVESAENQREKKSAFYEYLKYIVDRVEKATNQVFYFLWWFENGSAPEKGTYEVEIDKTFPTAPTDQELADQQQIYTMLGDFGVAGREAKAEIVASKLMSVQFSAVEKKTEEKRKQEIIKAIREEAKKEPPDPLAMAEARVLGRQKGEPVKPEDKEKPAA